MGVFPTGVEVVVVPLFAGMLSGWTLTGFVRLVLFLGIVHAPVAHMLVAAIHPLGLLL